MHKLTNLKLARLRAGLRQIDLAKKVNLSDAMIASLECGRTKPSVATLLKISKALGVSLEDLAKDFEPKEGAAGE